MPREGNEEVKECHRNILPLLRSQFENELEDIDQSHALSVQNGLLHSSLSTD